MTKTTLAKSIVASVLSLSSIAFASIDSEVNAECSKYDSSVTQDPTSTINRVLKATYGKSCLDLARSSEQKQDHLKAALIQKQQKECIQVVKNQCDITMVPADDSKCVMHKDAAGQKDYVVFYNDRLKLFTTVKGLTSNRCKIDQTYVAGYLAQTKAYAGNLVLVVNNKPMFFDENGEVRELLSGSGNSYVSKGAFIQSVETQDGGQTLVLVRRYSKDSGATQEIKIKENDLMDKSRTASVIESEYVQKEVLLHDGKDVYKVTADVIR